MLAEMVAEGSIGAKVADDPKVANVAEGLNVAMVAEGCPGAMVYELIDACVVPCWRVVMVTGVRAKVLLLLKDIRGYVVFVVELASVVDCRYDVRWLFDILE